MKTKVGLMPLLAVMLTACGFLNERVFEKVKTVSATDITVTSVTLTGELGVDINNYNSSSYGMLISDDEEKVRACEGIQIKSTNQHNQIFTVTTNTLSEETKYFYRAYLILNEKKYEYGDIKDFTTKPRERDGEENGHDFIDLGLSVKWATCNIGAAKPSAYGDYFSWGETAPKTNYSWENYSFYNGAPTLVTKYCLSSESGPVDGKFILEAEDDAASVNWGGKWHTPTEDEWDELSQKCIHHWVTKEGIKGLQLTSTINGKSIFLPATGDIRTTKFDQVGLFGHYWTANLLPKKFVEEGIITSYYATHIYLGEYYESYKRAYRNEGRAIRPVCP